MIPYNKISLTGRELDLVQEAINRSHLSGDGEFTRKCHSLLAERFGGRAFLTNSCTDALEMAALLLEIGPGDEVIMPSFTFVSTANAVVLRGGLPVFVDIDPATLNIDPHAVEAAIGPRTKAIFIVHYGSIACHMDRLCAIAADHCLSLVEDAAHCFGATYRGRPLGAFGNLATLSFHETKNIISGEGGALLVNDETLTRRAELLWQKGTNRTDFLEGRADRYTWVDIGSSFLPSEITAAFLYAQLCAADEINAGRIRVWNAYHERLESLERTGKLRRPVVPESCRHNAHLYYVLVNRAADRPRILAELRSGGVDAIFHYVPLHDSPAGKRFGRVASTMSVTEDLATRLIRLPLWSGLDEASVDHVIEAVAAAVT